VITPLFAAFLLILDSPRIATAHDVAMTSVARLFLDQIGPRRYLLSMIDPGTPPLDDPQQVLPAGCTASTDDTSAAPAARGFAFECDEELAADDIVMLPWSLAGVVVLARWADGIDASAYFAGTGTAVPIRLGDLRASARFSSLAPRYFALGAEHILFGVDHLLFVAGLLLLAQGVRRLVMTITAFTAAHSVTLGAAVMGLIPVDRGPVEAAIALSIVLVAREVVMGFRGHTHLVHRRPWLVAFLFGLLHGLGFAGALGQIGLRSADIPSALVFFNLGVEAGQLTFVGVLLTAHRMAREALRTFEPVLKTTLGYGLGATAMLWLFDRLPAVF
jgi:hydrogenase/urease accessory protein HupE